MGDRLNNKKLGITFLILSIAIAIVILQFMSSLTNEARNLGCYENAGCIKIESSLTLGHVAFGVIGFIFALGFYLLFFSKGEEALLQRIEEKETERSEEEKFSLISRGLDEDEKRVIRIIKEQEGITQNTLRIKSDLSKTKLSYVLQDLEKRGLIKREQKGKTLQIFLK